MEKSQSGNEREHRKKLERKEKNEFNPIIRDFFYKGTFQKTIEEVPGAYFVAINQFLKEMNEKKNKKHLIKKN